MDDPAILIALGAFLVAGLSALKTQRLSKRQRQIENDLRQYQHELLQEARTAKATAWIELLCYGDDVSIRNVGGSSARDITAV